MQKLMFFAVRKLERERVSVLDGDDCFYSYEFGSESIVVWHDLSNVFVPFLLPR